MRMNLKDSLYSISYDELKRRPDSFEENIINRSSAIFSACTSINKKKLISDEASSTVSVTKSQMD